MLFWGHTLIINKCDWRKFFPKIVKWLAPTISEGQKVTCSDSSLKLWAERKHAIE